ncbi:MAG: hypothetical protein WCT07_03795 [Candidatus Paceibacterota bacterium]|jgi:hypothetical protein
MNTFIILTTKYIFYPILIGVVSTVCYVLLFDQLLKNVILPWYFSKKYKSTRIAGTWEGQGNAGSFVFKVILKQTGDRVTGEIFASTINVATKAVLKTNTYSFTGEIRDGFVRVNHKEKDRDSFGFGCFIFQIAGGGKTLNGSCLYVSEGDDFYRIATANDIKLKRSSN